MPHAALMKLISDASTFIEKKGIVNVKRCDNEAYFSGNRCVHTENICHSCLKVCSSIITLQREENLHKHLKESSNHFTIAEC